MFHTMYRSLMFDGACNWFTDSSSLTHLVEHAPTDRPPGSLQENAVTQGKMMDIRRRMESLSLQRQTDTSEETLSVPSLLDECEPFKRNYSRAYESEDTFAPLYDGNYTRYDYDCTFTDRFTLPPLISPIGTRSCNPNEQSDDDLKLSDTLAGSILVKREDGAILEECIDSEECRLRQDATQLAAKSLAPIPTAEYAAKVALKTAEDIEVAATHFTNLIQVACWSTTPGISLKTPRHNYVPLEIRSKIQEKRRLRRVWQCGRHNEDKKALNKAIVELKENINNAKNATLTLHIESLTATKSTNYSLWKAGYVKLQPTRPPLRLADTKWARTAQQRLDAFANHLAEVFKPNDGTSNEDPNIEVFLTTKTNDQYQLFIFSLFSSRILPALSRHRNREHLHLSDEGLHLHRVRDAEHASEERLAAPPVKEKKLRVRCALCAKRLSIATVHTCRCGAAFCAPHRYAEVHGCAYDYKADAHRYLRRANPLVSAPKLPKI
ncbi:Uncharacterized protein OBRU01_15043 [Operophtera brumata]|uniref:AN1-type domain-containing protein n=1 Tax=Operophtera brumata TaxID=104452 RepID=A0A0L7L1T0_OPEBR|nr:Uncharacterized protein OBRU01_15043 [Operophtera brumata]